MRGTVHTVRVAQLPAKRQSSHQLEETDGRLAAGIGQTQGAAQCRRRRLLHGPEPADLTIELATKEERSVLQALTAQVAAGFRNAWASSIRVGGPRDSREEPSVRLRLRRGSIVPLGFRWCVSASAALYRSAIIHRRYELELSVRGYLRYRWTSAGVPVRVGKRPGSVCRCRRGLPRPTWTCA